MQFETMSHQLERSDILFEFLAIMRSAPILPWPLRPLQPLLYGPLLISHLVGYRRLWGSPTTA